MAAYSTTIGRRSAFVARRHATAGISGIYTSVPIVSRTHCNAHRIRGFAV
jgi:hypothetical protein